MAAIRVTTPSRLHFGLLSFGSTTARQFGGVGLMIDRPGIELMVDSAVEWSAQGLLAERALMIAQSAAARLGSQGVFVPPARLVTLRAAPEHAGLGTGTQLSLAVTTALVKRAGIPHVTPMMLATLSGRGRRSGVGLHGFQRGGLIVDGGRRGSEGIPPLLANLEFPPAWGALLVIPPGATGLHGGDEARAFEHLPPIPDAVTDRLCQLVLLGILPAVVEADIEAFGSALSELQRLVGEQFAAAQGGSYARPEVEAVATYLRLLGLHGVGQSSWGPTVYGFSDRPLDRRQTVVERVRAQFGLGAAHAFWASASNGAVIREMDPADAGQSGPDSK
jgi:beta-RFAP synthase